MAIAVQAARPDERNADFHRAPYFWPSGSRRLRCAGLLAPHGADEEGTHLRLKAHFGQLVYPKINTHGGRIVKNTGNVLLAEFPSVLGAVRCAVGSNLA